VYDSFGSTPNVCHDGDIGKVAGANDTRAIASYGRVMEIVTEGGI
jgi:hypothetical protein